MKMANAFFAMLAMVGTVLTQSADAALLDTAIAQWQFSAFETLGTGTNGTGVLTANRNNTGTLNDVRDLNGNQSWLTRYFNGGANGSTVGNAVLAADVQAVNSDLKSLNANTGTNYLIRDLSVLGDELIPTANTSYTVFARVFDPTFSGVDDIFRVGDWNSATNNYYALQTNSGVARFVTRGASEVADSILTGPTLSASTWYDITGVFDSGAQSLTLYVYDPKTGLQVGTTATLSSLAYTSLASGSSGNNTRNGGMYFTTGIANGTNDGARADLVAVWNTNLTQNEVASLSAVPEPSSFAMLLFGMIGMWLLRRK